VPNRQLGCYRPGMMTSDVRCPRCGTPVQPGGTVCERCEQPVDGPAYAIRYNPAGLATPSPIQGHATVLVGVLAAVAVLVFGAWYAFHGVGPFRAEVVRQVATPGSGLVIELRVSNDGDRAGKARCRATGVAPDGRLQATEVKLSPTVPGHGSVTFQLRADTLVGAHEVASTCA
jgi:hypothetical protein